MSLSGTAVKNEYEFDEEAIITAEAQRWRWKGIPLCKGKFCLPRTHTSNCGYTKWAIFVSLFHYKFPAYIGKQMYQGSVPFYSSTNAKQL